jgi:mannosylglycerate hydrolase
MTRKLTAYVVPHTHWDREWYQPFEVFRARLIDVVDRTLALLQDPTRDYRRFTLDGQAVVLDDYLAVRPERADEIAAQVAAGRLRVGPWFVLADEYLVSPEALVRNLREGARIAARFGGAMGVAYTPDSFGHIAQLPLLAHGFGLRAIVFERGVGDEGERLGSEFRWRAADGRTEVLTVHLIGTYSAATALGHLDWEYQDAYDPERAVRQLNAALYGPDAGEAAFPTWLRDALERLSGGIGAYSRHGAVLLLNGSDHLFPQENLPEVIALANDRIETVRFVHADVEEYIDHPRPATENLELHEGEFRRGRYHHVLSGVWSTRTDLKIANHGCETLLERYAEPLAAAARTLRGHDDRALLRHAWRTLLLNHAHDSICGCSVDAVHREMHTRFDLVRQTGEELCRRAIGALTAHVHERAEAIFEPLPEATDRVIHGTLTVPAGEGERVTLHDERGARLADQRRIERAPAPGRSDAAIDVIHYAAAVATTPLGLSLVHVRHDPDAAALASADRVTLERDANGHRMANRALTLTLGDDGAITLSGGGVTLPLALALDDEGDAGDAYDFSPVPGDARRTTTTPDGPVVALARGPLHAALAFDLTLTIPEGLADDRRTRLGATPLTARVTLTLDAFDPHVGVAVALHHTQRDHRLRLRLVTPLRTSTVASDGHWLLLERPIRPEAAPHHYQQPIPTVHQRRFSALSDGERGVALLARGLPEAEAFATEHGSDLSVTLLRAVGWLSRDDLLSRPQGAGPALPTPEAQCPGERHFALALLPFAGDLNDPRLHHAAERFIAPARPFPAGPRDPRPDLKPEGERATPDAAAALPWRVELTPPLTLSALAPAETGEGAIVRLSNPTRAPLSGTLRIAPAPLSATLVRLDETPLAALAVGDDGIVTLDVAPAEVVTVALTFPEGGDRPR